MTNFIRTHPAIAIAIGAALYYGGMVAAAFIATTITLLEHCQ